MSDRLPCLAVFTTLFPHPGQPGAGLFIRERMFRVGQHLPLTVVAPVPWFPLQDLIRRWRPNFRPPAPYAEKQGDVEVYHPRFLSIPGFCKFLDGWLLALGSLPTVLRLKRMGRVNILDSHFAYPDGYAATLIGRWLSLPVTITLRGTEVPISRTRVRRRMMLTALRRASWIFSVADALKRHVVSLDIDERKIQVVGNGVDTQKFKPISRTEARQTVGLPADAPVLISVGGLVERKGFHRVIERLPSLCARFPGLQYLVVGGASAEGDWSHRLRDLVASLRLDDVVRFLGPVPPTELKIPLSAADVFVLATRNEGWANVFLEAMACGLPVVTTDVGGNTEVVSDTRLGIIVPFGDDEALESGIARALQTDWDRQGIVAYAKANSWEGRITALISSFRLLAEQNTV